MIVCAEFPSPCWRRVGCLLCKGAIFQADGKHNGVWQAQWDARNGKGRNVCCALSLHRMWMVLSARADAQWQRSAWNPKRLARNEGCAPSLIFPQRRGRKCAMLYSDSGSGSGSGKMQQLQNGCAHAKQGDNDQIHKPRHNTHCHCGNQCANKATYRKAGQGAPCQH